MAKRKPKAGTSMEAVYRAADAHIEALKTLRLARIAEVEALARLKATIVSALASFQTPADREQLEAVARHYSLIESPQE